MKPKHIKVNFVLLYIREAFILNDSIFERWASSFVPKKRWEMEEVKVEK